MPQIEFNLGFHKGCGGEMPRGPGIYTEIHWPTMSLRVGASSLIWSKSGDQRDPNIS